MKKILFQLVINLMVGFLYPIWWIFEGRAIARAKPVNGEIKMWDDKIGTRSVSLREPEVGQST